MDTMYRRRTQLSVVAVAALAIVTVAAVMLLAGGAPAQADTASLAPDSGGSNLVPHQQTTPTPTPTPRHAPPPACSKDAAAVVDSGHIALFDVWWNPEELELTNSSCPPTVTHVKEVKKKGKVVSPARDDRSPSDIDIEKTVIHIPNSARTTLNVTKYPKREEGKDNYQALWNADAKENRDTNGDDTPDGVGDGIVWALPACPTDGSTDPVLCFLFSAGLLNPDDWLADSKITYHLDHVHQIDIDKQDPRYTLAYNVDSKGMPDLLWDSSNVRVTKMDVMPGGYERPTLFFTDRGTYELQVHITGKPDGAKADRISKDESVSSDVRTYIIHVGAEADLGVTATATPVNPSPGNEVTVTITASNAGPEAAPKTSVDVTLPPGLTYASHTAPANTTFTDGDGVWTWNAEALASGASKTLTIKAKVDKGTHGQKLTTKAAISATETLKITETVKNEETGEEKEVEKKYDVPVADPVADNDMATATVTVTSAANVDPVFMVMRSVAEESPAGTLVGDPIKVREPNSGDTLTFSLTGEGADQFAVSSVEGGAQIAVANGADLDFEVKRAYEFDLEVSDGSDANGNPDPSADDTIAVLIELKDMPGDPSVRISASATSQTRGEPVTFTATPENLPAGHGTVSYSWIATYVSAPVDQVYSTVYDFQSTWTSRNEDRHSRAGTWHYTVRASWQEEGGITKKIFSTNAVTVIWTD